MKKHLLFFYLIFSLGLSSHAQNIGDMSLIDAVTDKNTSISSSLKEKALVLVFHSMNCPFAKLYEERIIDIRTRFQNQGISFALVNSESVGKEQNPELLRSHIDETGLNMPYLMDEDHEWVKQFEITKLPEVIVLVPGEDGIKIAYRGAIDNNAQAESAVTEKFLERALNQILKGEQPGPSQVRAVGCNVRSF